MNNRLKTIIEEINGEISKINFGTTPANLYDPIYYIMDLGGKRIRPLLTLLAYRLFRDDHDKVIRPALSVEVFHNFTLLHDDLMDRAPLRRGDKTVHEKWNDNVAILSGDVMLVRVYDLLLQMESRYHGPLIAAFNQTAAEVCEGQQYDMDFETRESVSEVEYIEMIRLKTAVLLGFSLELGAALGDADDKDKAFLRSFGENIGIAFQLMDDLLDVYADIDKFGKKTGGDIVANKKTFLLIKALQLTEGEDRKELHDWLSVDNFDESEKIAAVRRIYDHYGLEELTRAKMNEYFDQGMTDLGRVSVAEERKENLVELANLLMKRES
jgi:geranylgeranyl diphosphate synthase type II